MHPRVVKCIRALHTLTRNGAGPSRRISITIQYVHMQENDILCAINACNTTVYMCEDASWLVKRGNSKSERETTAVTATANTQSFFMVH